MTFDKVAAAKAMAIFGAFEGFACACSATCLLGISLSLVFAILFTILLLLFTVAFAILAWKSQDDRFMKICAIIGAVVMPIAAVCCICVDDSVVKFSADKAEAKTPLYMVVAVAMMINFSINIIQLVKVMSCSDMKNRLLTNNRQIVSVLVMNIVLGLCVGLTFGLLKPEVEERTKRMTIVAVSFLFIGIFVGALYGLYNEWATQKMEGIGIDPVRQGDYDKM